MLIQSIFFLMFSLALTMCFTITAMSSIHTLAVNNAQRQMLAVAEITVERAREAANTTMQSIANQTNILPLLTPIGDSSEANGIIATHTTIDEVTSLNQTREPTTSPCALHDSTHQCNLNVGSGIAEQRVWETIDLHTTTLSAQSISMRRHVLLRLLRSQPYATVIAVRDDGTSGSALLGDASGVQSLASDSTKANGTSVATYRDTRVHVYEPCRFVISNNTAISTDRHNWANWQGGTAGPARQNTCDSGAGETSQYTSTLQSSTNRLSSSWGH